VEDEMAIAGIPEGDAVKSLRSSTEARFSAIFSSERSSDRRRTILFKNILAPTDGSDLAARAVEQGILFAKEIGAKITALTITEPFQLISAGSRSLSGTAERAA
jgi:hypothetical protein